MYCHHRVVRKFDGGGQNNTGSRVTPRSSISCRVHLASAKRPASSKRRVNTPTADNVERFRSTSRAKLLRHHPACTPRKRRRCHLLGIAVQFKYRNVYLTHDGRHKIELFVLQILQYVLAELGHIGFERLQPNGASGIILRAAAGGAEEGVHGRLDGSQ